MFLSKIAVYFSRCSGDWQQAFALMKEVASREYPERSKKCCACMHQSFDA